MDGGGERTSTDIGTGSTSSADEIQEANDKTELDADVIDRLMSGGKTSAEIAAMYGVHEKTPFNVLRKARERRI